MATDVSGMSACVMETNRDLNRNRVANRVTGRMLGIFERPYRHADIIEEGAAHARHLEFSSENTASMHCWSRARNLVDFAEILS